MSKACKYLFLFLCSAALSASSENNVKQTSTLLGSEISIEHEGEVYQCNKADLIAEDVNGTKVYHCPTAAAKRLETSSEDRGTAETERLKQEVKAETSGVEKVVLIENNESERRDRWVPFYYTEKIVKEVFPAKLYLSLRYGGLYEGSEFNLVDGGTRGGLFYFHKFENELELMYHFEAGVTFSAFDQIFGTDTQSDHIGLSPRLNYFSLKKMLTTMVIGKYWSTYYDISGMTDKFITFGALGDGTYNAGTDGGGSGTGRANNVLQLRFNKSDFNLGLQAQVHQGFFSLGNEALYDYCFGGSFFYKALASGIKLGVAMNYARYIDVSALADRGVDGNDYAYVGGLSYQEDDLSLDFTAAYTTNHVTDDAGYYFTSIGSELYTRYRITDAIRFTFGFNFLKPRDDNYVGDYEVEDYISSLQYGFDKRFDKMIYVEGKLSNGYNADGSETSNAISAGFRYLLDY